ncbi:putative tricarboxylic transport membrane protein [Aeromonas sp. BIGb0405]|jgi:putative tricarboxylic transport membrane protein|uniref:tripartite tricarboxylate transporter TctB family protein n=1 Tax=Aeromonas TaxID=642 RepID=UPI001CCA4F5C|nr:MULTISPECIES: tripartite tricarboxylate transporter TctB family protein [Aeromonas]MCS3455737.1 putative tricarboxylic transport membrane protein [Aeromonas sp. BIGb0405]MCS3458848.1 putative tricarboxylic transport membrane protein [Aeromonas sp. BIGb0445]UBO72519.1 tripartite tricarboxylate transporter TctB family protein [Aeromonas rivuli]
MNITKERFGGLLFLLISLIYGFYATQIPSSPGDEFEPFTASTLPYALAAIGVVLSIVLLAFPGGERLGKEEGNWRLVFSLLLLMVAYGFALTWLGFLISTILFVMVGIRLMGEPRWSYAIKISLPFTLCFWALLTKGLHVYLEPGRLFTQLMG